MTAISLYSPLPIGRYTLQNRVVMAPMTRSRADAQGVQPAIAAEYYGQRAGAGLIISEGTQTSFAAQGYARTPGIHTSEQIAAWRAVTDAAHQRGATIFVQLMHAGRVAHPLNRQTDEPAVAPSAIAPETTQMYTDQEGMQPIPTPRALETGEIPGVIDEHVRAAGCAIDAGFDGVELHAASGYLPMQFLSSGTNHRTDRYGGSVENRMRFILEALEALIGAVGADRVGIKLSPDMQFNDCSDDNPEHTYTALVKALSPLGLAYLHVGKFTDKFDVHATLRPLFDGPYLANGGLRSYEDGQRLLDAGQADAAVYGQLYLANPDLVERFKQGAALNEADPDTFYTPGPQGYTDYPTLADSR